MKKILLKLFVLTILLFLLVGCNRLDNVETSGKSQPEYSSMNVSEDDLFRLSLYIVNKQLKADEPIEIYSTLEYIGENENITIWGGKPYIIYTLYDAQGVCYTEGLIFAVLESRTINRGEVRTFPFQKSRGWSADDPDAKYWEAFSSDPDLKLPKGTYTLTVGCAFDLTEDGQDYQNSVETEFVVN